MTTRAVGLGRTEGATNVTALAGDIGVAAVKHKPGAEMVEGRLSLGETRREQHGCGNEQHKHAHELLSEKSKRTRICSCEDHCSDLTSSNESDV